MKYSIFLFFLCMSSLGFAQKTSDEAQVEKLIQDSFDELFSNFQSDQIQDFYTSDFILLEQGEIWDYQMVLDYFQKSAMAPQKSERLNRFEFIKTTIDGDRAWTSYWNYATITAANGAIRELKWLESATAIKTSLGWRLDMLHSTRVETAEDE